MNWGFFSVVVFSDLTEDEKLAKLCQKLKEKHAGEPIILFIDENDITSTGNFSPKFSLKKLDDFHIISAISPIVENYVRLKSTGFDFNEMDICIKDENCLWVNLYLRYRNFFAANVSRRKQVFYRDSRRDDRTYTEIEIIHRFLEKME